VRVLVAPDKFKGTMTAAEAAEAIATGWQRTDPRAEIDRVPLADGGEGTLDALLGSEEVVRVRVPRERETAATTTLAAIAPVTTLSTDQSEPEVWLAVRTPPRRASEVNRILATAGIYASGLESGSDLEMLFLELTGGEPVAGSEGTFQGVGGAATRPSGKRP